MGQPKKKGCLHYSEKIGESKTTNSCTDIKIVKEVKVCRSGGVGWGHPDMSLAVQVLLLRLKPGLDHLTSSRQIDTSIDKMGAGMSAQCISMAVD